MRFLLVDGVKTFRLPPPTFRFRTGVSDSDMHALKKYDEIRHLKFLVFSIPPPHPPINLLRPSRSFSLPRILFFSQDPSKRALFLSGKIKIRKGANKIKGTSTLNLYMMSKHSAAFACDEKASVLVFGLKNSKIEVS